MNYLEILNAKEKYIQGFRNQSNKDFITFLNFNRYHHERPFQEILSLFIQSPDARYVRSFDFWKNFTEESYEEFEQKNAIKIYDSKGNLLEVLFDITQVELSSIPKIKNTVLTEEAQALIDYFIHEKSKEIRHKESNAISLLLKYNLYEEFGILLNNDQAYNVLLNSLTDDLKNYLLVGKFIEFFGFVNQVTIDLSTKILVSYKSSLW